MLASTAMDPKRRIGSGVPITGASMCALVAPRRESQLTQEQAKLQAGKKRYRTEMFRPVLARMLSIVVAFIAATAAAHAHPAPASSDVRVWEVAQANQRFSVSGVVQSVDYASNTVTVKTGSQTVDITVTPTTVFDEHGETGSMGDIRKGAKISASGIVRNGHKVALSITIK